MNKDSSRTLLSVLLDGLIDYAGLYPPAILGMEDMVSAWASTRASSLSQADWMLGRVIVPIESRLDEFEKAAAA